ncbi:glycosyltransferase family 39 protein [Rhodobacteraceae bacterium B1Z28]|uniref:Glycosyltransferase family 39 protein n=1 Tax=Ruegeria haliotis TaxID=2747601 RepID=A0ABX2PQK6_9RHOB|nr:glycosyltransferase family 39 protein [Ruegeria haliotis]NVO56393.1 glycosyltransferase family 39 protein [Ruegeria haliotis]
MNTVRSNQMDRADFMWCAGLAVLAVVLFVVATPWGIGIRPDSAFYLGFPFFLQGNSPGYVWAIELVSATGLDSISAATLLNMGFFSLNALIVYVLVRGSGASRLIAAIAGLLILTSPLVFELHVTVLSEGMFIFLLLVTLVLLSMYADSGALRFLLAAGLVSILVFLTRFNGAPVWVVGVLTVAFLGPQSGKTKVMHALAFVAVVILPLLLWSLIEARTGGTGLGREFGFLGNPSLEILMQGANSIWVSFFPNIVPGFVKVLATFAVIALLVAVVWHETNKCVFSGGKETNTKFATFPLIATVYIFGHFALLLLSLLIESYLPLKPSYFAPVYVLIVVIGAQYSTMLRKAGNKGWQTLLGTSLLVLGALVLTSNLARTGNLVVKYRSEGIFFAGPQWYQSPLVSEINNLDPEVFVYTNAPDVVHLLTGNGTTWIPMRFNRRTGKEHPTRPYQKTLTEMREGLAQGKAVVAFFDEVTWRFYLPTQQELTEELDLTEMVKTTDGTLLHVVAN